MATVRSASHPARHIQVVDAEQSPPDRARSIHQPIPLRAAPQSPVPECRGPGRSMRTALGLLVLASLRPWPGCEGWWIAVGRTWRGPLRYPCVITRRRDL